MKIYLIASAIFVMMCISSVHLLTLKALPKRNCKLRSDVGKPPQDGNVEDEPEVDFVMDAKTATAGCISISKDGLTATTTKPGWCVVRGTKSYTSGVHSWSVKLGPKAPWVTRYHLNLGVSTIPNPSIWPQQAGSGVYGTSVSAIRDGFRVSNGASTPHYLGNYAQPGDIIKSTIDFTAGTFRMECETQYWEETMTVPKNVPLWPVFNTLDMPSFTLVKNLDLVQPQEDGAGAADFLLNANSARGDGISISKDGLTGTYTKAAWTVVRGSKLYKSGVVSWSVKLGQTAPWSGQFFILLGVSTSKWIYDLPMHEKGGVYGMSVSGNRNGLRFAEGNGKIQYYSGLYGQPNDIIKATIDFTAGTFTLESETRKWKETIKVPKNVPLWPIFYNLDMPSFTLVQ